MESKTNSEETFDATEELRDLNENIGAGASGDNKKRERTIFGTSYGDAAKSSEQSVQGLNHELELSQNFFLDDNANCGQQQQQQHFILKKTIRRCSSRRKRIYNPTKVKWRDFVTNISYNRLRNMDFNNALFIIDCFTYILFNLNPSFLERKFDNEYDS